MAHKAPKRPLRPRSAGRMAGGAANIAAYLLSLQ